MMSSVFSDFRKKALSKKMFFVWNEENRLEHPFWTAPQFNCWLLKITYQESEFITNNCITFLRHKITWNTNKSISVPKKNPNYRFFFDPSSSISTHSQFPHFELQSLVKMQEKSFYFENISTKRRNEKEIFLIKDAKKRVIVERV